MPLKSKKIAKGKFFAKYHRNALNMIVIHFLTSARGDIVPGKKAERNAKGGQCRVQCTRGSHLCSDTRGKAVRNAQDRPEQQWMLKKTRSTTLPPSAMEPRSLTVATQTKYWKYLGNIGNIWEILEIFGKYWKYLAAAEAAAAQKESNELVSSA